MKKTAFLLICFFTLTTVGAQTMTRLNGVILDKTTKSPVAYAAIGIVGKQIGTVANAEGNFLFNTGANSLNDTIIITGLGYYPFKSVIRELVKERPLIIELTSQVYNLSEVHVNTKKMTAVEILKKAEKKFNENINRNPYLMKAYYREFLKEDSVFSVAAEAATTIYRVYKNRWEGSPKIKVDAVRSSDDYRQKDYFLNDWMTINLSGAFPLKRLVPDNGWKSHKFEIDSLCMYKDRLVYIITLHEISESKYIYRYEIVTDKLTNEEVERVIDSVPNKSIGEWTATYYIDALSFAFVKVEFTSVERYTEFSEKRLFNNYHKIDGKEYIWRWPINDFFIEYQQFGSFWYPVHFFWYFEEWNYDVETKEPFLKNKIYSEFFVNEIITDTVEEIPLGQIHTDYQSIFMLPSQADSSFWENYNMIPDDSLRREVFRDLEKLKANRKK